MNSQDQIPGKVAVITGITGQDGSYLTELLLSKDYVVHGLVRRSSSIDRRRLQHLYEDESVYGKCLFLHYGDLDDTTALRRWLLRVRPDEVYHLAGQSHVGLSFEIPESTCDFTAMGTLRLLEILRDLDPVPRFLHTSSSEVFGAPDVSPQDEHTPFRPVTPYGVAKAFATNMVSVYRDAHKMFTCNAICFNHESIRRGESFVTRKITRAAAMIKLGLAQSVSLGNLDTSRDWGFAPEYVNAMWLMLQQDCADDFVLATGRVHSVRDLLEVVFGELDLSWEDKVQLDPRFVRPAEGIQLVGDATRIRSKIGWHATTVFEDFMRQIVREELQILAQQHS